MCEYGSYIGKPSVSKDEAASTTVNQKLTSTFSMGGDFLRLMKADASYKDVTDITVTISNVSVEEIPENIFFSGVSSQEPTCTKAINDYNDRSCLGFL